MELSKASQNNNLLTALENTEIKPAMEVLWTTPSNSSRIAESSMKINTHTKLLNKHAAKQLDLSRSADSLISRTAIPSPLLLPEDPSQLPLMPPTGHHTRVEFSTTARPPLTTESSLSVFLINIGK
jgi:hypothetical protein